MNFFRAGLGILPTTFPVLACVRLLMCCAPASQAADHRHGPTGTNTEWNWPDTPLNPDGRTGYRSFEHILAIEIEPDKEAGYFWSHQVGFIGGDTAYFGLQTLGRRPDGSEGKVAIFSVWNALGASGPGIAQPFGGEGEGYQTLIPYDWKTGRKYRLRIFQSGENGKGTRWTSVVRDETTGKEVEIGTITVPRKWGRLGNWSIMWSERYTGSEIRDCRDVGHSKVFFGVPGANNGEVHPANRRSFLSEPVNCPNSRITDTRDGVLQEMGFANEQGTRAEGKKPPMGNNGHSSNSRGIPE